MLPDDFFDKCSWQAIFSLKRIGVYVYNYKYKFNVCLASKIDFKNENSILHNYFNENKTYIFTIDTIDMLNTKYYEEFLNLLCLKKSFDVNIKYISRILNETEITNLLTNVEIIKKYNKIFLELQLSNEKNYFDYTTMMINSENTSFTASNKIKESNLKSLLEQYNLELPKTWTVNIQIKEERQSEHCYFLLSPDICIYQDIKSKYSKCEYDNCPFKLIKEEKKDINNKKFDRIIKLKGN